MENGREDGNGVRKTASSPFRVETPLYLIGWLVAALIIVIVATIFWSMFQEGLPSTKNLLRFSLENFKIVFGSPGFGKAALRTFELGVGMTVVATGVGLPLTWVIHRTNLWGKQFFSTLMFLNILLPGFIKIMGWILLLGPQIGIINLAVRAVFPWIESGPFSPYNIGFMIFLEGIGAVPTFFLMIGGAFASIDPSLEEAAEASGLNRAQIFRKISLPILMPAILTSIIFIFVMSISGYETAALLGAPNRLHFLSTLMFDALNPEVGIPLYGVAGVYAVIMLVPTMIGLYYYQRMMRLSHRFATITGKGYRPKLTDLGKWKVPAMAFVVLYFVINLLLPFLAVVWTSITPSIQLPSAQAFRSVTLAYYPKAFLTLLSQKAIANTILLSLTVGIVGTLLGLIMSWITTRTKMRGRYVLDTFAMMPHVIPGIAIAFAMAFLGLLLAKVVPLYQSMAAIIIANLVKTMPFSTRTMNASLMQIHSELEEAVQTSGASKVVALRKVIVPLITPALVYSFIWTLLQTYKEVTIPLFLISPKNMVLSTVIWTQWSKSANFSVASAISIIMIVVMAVVVSILLKALPGQIRKGF